MSSSKWMPWQRFPPRTSRVAKGRSSFLIFLDLAAPLVLLLFAGAKSGRPGCAEVRSKFGCLGDEKRGMYAEK